MNSNNFFLEELKQETGTQNSSSVQPPKSAFKLTQLASNVKNLAKLLICFKSLSDGRDYYALENIKGCQDAPNTNREQTQTTYTDDKTLASFLQDNQDIILKIRYLEKHSSLLCLVEVSDRRLTLPPDLALQWLTFNRANQYLQFDDQEDFKALLLTV